MNHPAALFDLDGTLIEFPAQYWCREGERIFSKKLGYFVGSEFLYGQLADFNFFGFKGAQMAPQLEKWFWKELDYSSCPTAKLNPHVNESLQRLIDSNFKIALVTSRRDDPFEIEQLLENLGIGKWVTEIVCAGKRFANPLDKGPLIQEACMRLGAVAAKSLFVGDTPTDIRSAKSAEIRTTIAVCTGHVKSARLLVEEPTYVIPNLSLLPTVVQERPL